MTTYRLKTAQGSNSPHAQFVILYTFNCPKHDPLLICIRVSHETSGKFQKHLSKGRRNVVKNIFFN